MEFQLEPFARAADDAGGDGGGGSTSSTASSTASTRSSGSSSSGDGGSSLPSPIGSQPGAPAGGPGATAGGGTRRAAGDPDGARPEKRRRRSGKQAPPPEGIDHLYDVTRARVEHIEAFGGVYGKVWVVRDHVDGKRWWLKQVKSHSWPDGLPEHGVREVAILKDLATVGQCPHVMSVKNVLAARQAARQCHRLHIVAEHASYDLVTYVKSRELSAATVHSFSRQLTSAVDFIHSRGVLHRNLKPASVLVSPSGQIVVSGFETAIRCTPESVYAGSSGFILRTHIAVRSPELLLGLGRDHPGMDVWALGCCVAFLALCGSLFQPEDNTDLAACKEIFYRLGKPDKDHVLAKLPLFDSYDVPWREPTGLEPASRLLGERGLSFLAALLDLDYTRRLSAVAALRHRYLVEGIGLFGALPAPDAPEAPRPPMCDTSSPSTDSQVVSEGGSWSSDVQGREVARHYIARDLRRESEQRRWSVATLCVLHARLQRIPGLCQHVWSFLRRPRCPQPDYMLGLVFIKEWMREVLIDWLVEVHWKWRLQPGALLLAVNLIDRYLARNPSLLTHRFQLLGVAALFLAAKVEDEHYDTDMSATTLAWITDRAYTIAEVLDMEAALAKSVDFEAPAWGAYHFLCRYAAIRPLPRRHFFVAQCYLEQSLCIYRLTRHPPSLLACACYYLAAQLPPEPEPEEELPDVAMVGAEMLGVQEWPHQPVRREALAPAAVAAAEPWPRELEEEARRTEAEVKPCALELREAVAGFEGRGSSGKPLVAVRNKFARAVHLHAAELVWSPGTGPGSSASGALQRGSVAAAWGQGGE